LEKEIITLLNVVNIFIYKGDKLMATQVRSVLSKFFNVGSDDYDEDYEDDYEYDDYEEDDYEEAPKKSFFKRRKDDYYDDDFEEDTSKSSKKSSGKIKSVPRGDRRMEIVVLKPTNFDTDSRKITEHLKYNRTVMIDLEGITIDLAQRIVDYASGSSNAIEGDFSIVSKNFVIVSPPAVLVSGDVVSSNDSSGAVNIME